MNVREWVRRAAVVTAAAGLAAAVLVTLFSVWPRLFVSGGDGHRLDAAHGRLDEMLVEARERPIPFGATEGLRTLRDALLLAEDDEFFSRGQTLPPVSPSGVARSVVAMLTGGPLRGGSTIEQQLAKIVVQEPEGLARRTLRQKLRELVFATEMVRRVPRPELFNLYAKLALSIGKRDPERGAEEAALALRGKPLSSISREDALYLACLPRGFSKVRRNGRLLTARIGTLLNRLIDNGKWDVTRPSYLSDASWPKSLTRVEGWRAFATSGAADPDLGAALSVAHREIEKHLHALEEAGVPATGGVLLARGDGSTVYSDPSLAGAPINLASGAKLALLDVALDRLGEHEVQSARVSTGGGVRWWWKAGGGPRPGGRPGFITPNDAGDEERLKERGPLTAPEIVAYSVNSAAMRFLVDELPYRLFIRDPGRTLEELRRLVPEAEVLSTPGERRVTANHLRRLGLDLDETQIPAELGAQAAGLYAIRLLAERRRDVGLTLRRALPEDPTSLLGNSSSERPEAVARGLLRTFFFSEDTCLPGPVGASLAPYFEEGTAKRLASQVPEDFGRTAWKTGTSPHDDGIWLAVALCLDDSPAVALAAIRTTSDASLPPRTYAGARLSKALAVLLGDLAERGRAPKGLIPPIDYGTLSAEAPSEVPFDVDVAGDPLFDLD